MTVTAGAAGCAGKQTPGGKGGPTAGDKNYSVAVASFHNALYEDAKVQIEAALRANPKHAEALYLRGVIALNEGKTMIEALEAERCLQDAAADQQRMHAEELHRKAYADFEAAAGLFEEESGGRGRAYNSMSVVSLFFHDHAKAIKEAEKALAHRFYAQRYSALANLGWAHFEAGNKVEAMTELREAVRMNPDYCVGRYRLASVYLGESMYPEAVEQAESVMNDERCPIQDAYRIAADARVAMGGAQEAVGAYEGCMAVAPRSCLARDCALGLGRVGGGTAAAPTP